VNRPLLLSLVAALLYAVGALCMKASDGLQRLLPAAGLYACFVIGATFQAFALRGGDVGAGNTIVLGVEAVCSLLLGAVIFGEALTPPKLVAVALVSTGVWILRH
jgi:quaternary ammonium compound-resistance protein SugE